MRKTILTICCLLPGHINFAQTAARTLIYGNISGDFGSPMGFRSTLSCLFARHHEVSAGFNYYSRRGRDIPEDYHSTGLFSNEELYPQQTYTGGRITYSYVLYPRRRADQIRLAIGAGIAYGRLSSPYNYVKNTGKGFFSFTNWTNDIRDENQGMFLMNAMVHLTPCRGFGFSLGPYAVISDGFSGGGFSAGILFGKVGNHIPIRDPIKVAASRARHQKKIFWKK